MTSPDDRVLADLRAVGDTLRNDAIRSILNGERAEPPGDYEVIVDRLDNGSRR